MKIEGYEVNKDDFPITVKVKGWTGREVNQTERFATPYEYQMFRHHERKSGAVYIYNVLEICSL